MDDCTVSSQFRPSYSAHRVLKKVRRGIKLRYLGLRHDQHLITVHDSVDTMRDLGILSIEYR
jgi:hypothetical protein